MSALIGATAAVAAGLAGIGIGSQWSRRPRVARPPAAEPVIAAAVPPAPPTPVSDLVAVLDTLPLGVVVVSADGTERFRNAASRASAATHTGLLIDDAVRQALRRAVRGDESARTLELYGPPTVAVVVRAQPIPGGGAMATVEDISERRRVDAVRTDFVANISHELKTPIGAMAVLADALSDAGDPQTGDPDVVVRLAGRIAVESERLSRTIDDLMELSRIELGEEPVRDVVAIGDVVRETIDRARSFAESRGIELAVLDAGSALTVIGDRRQLISALGNLVENAIKYSEPGSAVQLRSRATDDVVEVMVVDNGIGIPPSEQTRIFERFYRVDRARSRTTGGTGLGLSIVRHIATNHHGEIVVSSEEGRGSTFVLRLPSTRAGSAPDASANAPEREREQR